MAFPYEATFEDIGHVSPAVRHLSIGILTLEPAGSATAPRRLPGTSRTCTLRAASRARLGPNMDYPWYMSMKRTNVYADPEDLAIIKEAATRRGISEAEIIRQGIHLAAMANRIWDEPLFSRTFEGTGRTPSKEDVRDAVASAALKGSGSENPS
ncbi:hypothetical protein SAMN05216499_1473 [Actinacidiphila paucisporea]|uniref:Ribbon-helix-helix protein CopG domain-containing protein n=2 Tax=Actinacidiphila paucisporea TaxID=310782 RepID=A0A1M7QWW6_9ACTN|nr:hypothetical protein SAMN05216499_1473 [Actinacidiphila paucisporea]